jgi:peroxiredoxin Q/BCP
MKAPNFSLPNQDGIPVSLEDFSGKWVIVYFYPKDDTPGCTTEACSFRDQIQEFEGKGIAILGISKDSVGSHKKFVDKYDLPFSVLSDKDATTIQAYGAWGTKKFMGKEYDGIMRKTFIITPEGDIAKEYPEVTPADHAQELLQDLTTLGAV